MFKEISLDFRFSFPSLFAEVLYAISIQIEGEFNKKAVHFQIRWPHKRHL